MRKVVVQYSDEERLAFIRKHEAEWRTVGTLIFNIRTELRISQDRLAREAGICVNTLRKLEKGQYIRRFKLVSRSCINSLIAIVYDDFIRTTQGVKGQA